MNVIEFVVTLTAAVVFVGVLLMFERKPEGVESDGRAEDDGDEEF